MIYKYFGDNDIIKVCKCGKTIMTWQTVCSNYNTINTSSIRYNN